MIPQVTSAQFEEEVLKADRPVLVEIYKDWCGPCRRFEWELEQVQKYAGDKIKIVKLDADDATADPESYANIFLRAAHGTKEAMPIPMLLVFEHTALCQNVLVGNGPAVKILEWVEAQLGRELVAPGTMLPARSVQGGPG